MSSEEQQSPEDEEVRLKPILGVEPHRYVPVLYGLVLVLILFVVLVLPGIRHHGSMVTIVTAPPVASLRVDGVRLGASPGTYFVASGSREIEVSRPGFGTYRETVEVPGRLFGSWLFPRRMRLRIVLGGADPDRLVQAAIGEFSNWSLTGEASGQYQFPPIARPLAADLRAAAEAPDTTAADDAWATFVDAALPHVASEALLNDLAAGALGMGGASSVAVPSGIAATLQHLARTAENAELVPLQIAASLSRERRDVVSETAWAEAATVRARELSELRFEGSASVAGAPQTFALGLSFVRLSGGTAVLGGESGAARGGEVPYEVSVEPYLLALTETPYSAYAAFLRANPDWSRENIDELLERGLVDEGYLADRARMEADTRLPVTGVSAHAAAAFAEWYTTQLPAGFVARLPSEAEWDFARAVSGQADGVFAGAASDGPVPVSEAGAGNAGIVGLLGNVWEWTADSFAPYSLVYGGASRSSGAHAVVRGGGWATESVGFRGGDRGALDRSWCSPFVGFRLVVSPAQQ
ncbi:MAG: formylglycine-generating enzyme family protein [Spirochaetota bacterium]